MYSFARLVMSIGLEAPFNNTGEAEICLLSGQQSGIIKLGAKNGWMESFYLCFF